MNKTLRKLAVLVLAIALSASAIVGGTYAWFTDSVTSARNTIQSGNLDIKVEYKTPDSTKWEELEDNTVLFGEKDLWEPGHVEAAALRITNAGTLALDYQVITNVYEEKSSTNVYDKEFKLSDYLVVNAQVNEGTQIGEIMADLAISGRDKIITNSAKLGVPVVTGGGATATADEYRLVPGQVHIIALAITMPTDVDNNANHKTGVAAPSISFGVDVVAKQAMHESDSFGNDYDEKALYPVHNAGELVDALSAGKSVKLNADVDLAENTNITIPAGSAATIDLGGNTLTAKSNEGKASSAIENKGTLAIKNGTVSYEGVGDPNFGYGTNTINNSGKLVIDGATIINTTNSGSSNAIDNAPGSELIVNSGTIKGEKVTIRLRDNSTATINGGEISGARAVQIHLFQNVKQPTTLTINGGTFNGTEMALYSYAYGNCTFDQTTVNITGGTFNDDVCFGGGNKTAKETVNITGGTFNGYLGRYLADDGWEDIDKPA